MVKIINNKKKPSSGFKIEGKQKVLQKQKENNDLKNKIKKVKDSEVLKANIKNLVEAKVKKSGKKVSKKSHGKSTPEGIDVGKSSKIKSKGIQKSAKKGSKNTKNKKTGEVKADKKSSINSTFEAKSFDETKFESIVNLVNIEQQCKALKKLVEDEVTERKTSIFTDYRYVLNVGCYKIPNSPKRMVKLNLKHSLVDSNEDDVVIIVPDLQRGAKVDYEPTIQHYEDLFQECGVKGLKIIPFNQLRNEYTTFEAKRKLANTYDYFLCDGRIAGHVVGFCGKIFQKPRTTIHSVHLDEPQNYKANIEKALKRTSFKQLNKGTLISIPVGSYRLTTSQLAENIMFVIDQLKKVYPGGYSNVRNMYVKIDIKGTSALPIYISLAGPPPETPNVIGPREKRMLKLKKQANDVLSKFSVSKSGDFVKLNKSQVKHKQQIREARAVLLSEENDDDKEIMSPPTKKTKKSNAAKQGEAKASENFVDMDEDDEGDVHTDDEKD